MYIYHTFDDWTPQSYPLRLGLPSYSATYTPQFSLLSTPPPSVLSTKGEYSKNCYIDEYIDLNFWNNTSCTHHTFDSLCENMPNALASVPLERIRKWEHRF
jgi:hypothetical protein